MLKAFVMSFRKVFLCCALVLIAGCDNSFDPKEEYQERIVVFAVLDVTSPVQVVRLERTFDAAGTNPNEPIGKQPVTDAKVRIQTNKRTFTLTDTLVDIGAGTMKKIWITRELLPVEGAVYTLLVEVPGLPAISSQATVPSRAFVQLLAPDVAGLRKGVELRAGAISTSATPRGFYFRLWITGEKTVNGKRVELRYEIPRGIDPKTGNTEYTKPSRDISVEFPTEFLADLRARLEQTDSTQNIQVVGTAYSLDTYLYAYYQTVRGFDDPVSVRQDKPDFTNIDGGIGVFGAISTDSVRISYNSLIPR